MRVLPDEDVPRRFKRELSGHDVSTVVEMGWSSIKNGVLLHLAVDAGFEALVACDRNIQHQQNVSKLGLALVVLAVPNKQVNTIRPLIPAVCAALDAVPQAGTVAVVGSWRV